MSPSRILLLLTLMLVGLVTLFQQIGVLFGTSCLFSLVLVVVFLTSEGSPLLFAQEAENRFWTVVATLLSSVVFFAEDSPLRIGHKSPLAGCIAVGVFTCWISWYDRWLRRRRLVRAPHFAKPSSTENLRTLAADPAELDASIEALAKVDEAVARLDHYFIPSTITRLWRRRETARVERFIIETLQDCGADDLNMILRRVKLGLLVYKLKDSEPMKSWADYAASFLFSPSTKGARTELVDLLAVQRVADLNVRSRVVLLDALQQMPLSACPRRGELWVRNVMLWTRGDELTELKTLCDLKGDVHSLHKLVYQDIRESSIRTDILKHVQREASVQSAHRLLRTRKSARSNRGSRKVLSDLDDTLLCSGGHYPAGLDKRWPRKAIYPGVLAFYRELDLGTDEGDFRSRLGNLVFLSARPHVFSDLAERSSYAKFAHLLQAKRLHTMPTLLTGDLKTGGEMMLRGDMEPLAQKKAQNFLEFQALYPEFDFVFVGDNGQGDARAAELMAAASSPRGGRLERAYIHIVQPIDRTHRGRHHDTPESAREAWDKAGVVFVETFVDAALDACSRKFISPLGLRRVGVAAKKDFEVIQWAADDRRKDMRRQELDDALRRLNRALVVDYGLDAVPLCDAVAPVSVRKRKSGSVQLEGVIEPGRAVVTPVGPGIVLSSRTSKDIGLVYEVALDEWRLCDRNPARAYIPSGQIVYEQSRKTALEAFRSSKQEPAPTSASDADWMALSEVRRRTDSAGSLGEAAGRAQ
mmetsp:Transcript_23209/g.60433  ORF Transcript_23209/g.60433 Transcript_23209/m.60433 type:complete len:755 (-) Transcript_23209:25-2289(-)